MTTLSEKNVRAYLFWRELRGAPGYLTAWSALSRQLPDKLTLAILANVDDVVRQYELQVQVEAMSLGAVSAATRGGR